MGPKGVAVDKNGHIIAADNKACCVFIFQSNGKLVTKFGAKGTLDRQFTGASYFLSFFIAQKYVGPSSSQCLVNLLIQI